MVQNSINNKLIYTGKKQPKLGEKFCFDPEDEKEKERELEPYFSPDNLIEVVNLAILLERPLLLKGEPGCGKTRLAYHVAYELGLPFKSWYIKSTSRARDGLYTYDTVGRLRDSQLAANNMINQQDLAHINDPANYVKWGAIGKAFRNKKKTVILIDEIDKADIDFPNDLLLELDESRFFIEETGEMVYAKEKPIVFITSNDEKSLPDAFLRRCLFHFMKFPDKQRLIQIVLKLFPRNKEEVIEQAVNRFLELRDKMKVDKGNAGKKVSTSELIDWFRVLSDYPEDEILQKLEGKLPFPSVLLKSWEDHRRYLAQNESNEDGEL